MSGGGGSPSPFSGPDVLGAAGAQAAADASGAALAGIAAGTLVCDALEFEARLHSVDRDQLDQVNVGQTLHVLLFQATRLQVGAFISTDPAAAPPVGVLIDRLVELFPCLGIRDFDAEVLSINGGDVRVRVSPAAG